VRGLIADSGVGIELRQCKCLNKVVEQDQRANKKRTRPMMGFKSFRPAVKILSGIENLQMVKKGQLRCSGGLVVSDAARFYCLPTRCAIWPQA
jgi:putative transposase